MWQITNCISLNSKQRPSLNNKVQNITVINQRKCCSLFEYILLPSFFILNQFPLRFIHIYF